MTTCNFSTNTALFTLAMLLFGMSSTTTANDLDLRVSDDAIHGNLTLENDESTLGYGLGYFYKDSNEAINIVNVDLHTKGQTAISNMPTTVGIGIQGNYFKEDALKGSAIAIGGSVRVNLPDIPGTSIQTEAHYAPDVLAFGDADTYTRANVQMNYRIIRTADISAGYRYLNASLKAGSHRTFESGFFVGIKMNF